MVNSKEIYSYAICYPQIRHPLYMRKKELKLNYVGLLEYYANQYCGGNPIVKIRLIDFRRVLLDDIDEFPNINTDIKSMANNVLKTRFIPFRLFSYRYLFLFDCLMTLAPDNPELGKKISYDLKSLVHTRYHNEIDLMVKQMYSANYEYVNKHMITNEMICVWSSVQSYVKSHNRNITFTATMSAGKSTLINAIIGQELSYAKKAACTATVMKFISAPIVGCLSNVFSENENNTCLKPDEVRKLTKKRETPCDIVCHFDSVLSKHKITLIDTPGVNSSQNPEHKKITRKELTGEETDLLVYVIPVENYGSEGDYLHLSYIKKKVQYNNIVFAVNMMDTCDFEDDSVQEIVSDIKEHLIGIGYENPIVCPMSAKAGMLIKQALSGNKLLKNDKNRCETFVNIFTGEDLCLGKYYPSTVELKISNTKDLQNVGIDVEKIKNAYINTGLPGFEKLLFDMSEEEKAICRM